MAGLAAFAVATQLSTEQHDQALSQATTALTMANERLATSRDKLEHTRNQLRLTQDKLLHAQHAHRVKRVGDATLTTITHTGLNCPTEHYCQIHREMINAEVKPESQHPVDARFIVSNDGGQPNGLKIYCIRGHSLLSRLGFRNGDRIDTINGQAASMETMRTFAATYAHGSAMTLNIELQRRGQPLSKRFDIL